MADLGTDFAGVNDVDATLTETGGRRGLAEALARRLSTQYLWYDSTYGYDMRAFIGTSTPAPMIETGAEEQCLLDERVHNCKVTASRTAISAGREALNINISITDEDGDFSFTVLVTDLTVEILRLQD